MSITLSEQIAEDSSLTLLLEIEEQSVESSISRMYSYVFMNVSQSFGNKGLQVYVFTFPIEYQVVQLRL